MIIPRRGRANILMFKSRGVVFKEIYFLFLMMFILAPPPKAFAADGSLDAFFLSSGKEDRKNWRASVDETWMPSSAIRGDGDAAIFDTKVGLSRAYPVADGWSLTTGAAYSLKSIDAPASARLPDKLHTLSIRIGANYKYSKDMTLGLMAAPGLHGDFKGSLSGGDIRVPLAFIMRYKYSQQLMFIGGLGYNTAYLKTRVLPIFGVVYKPDERWTISLGAPRTAVSYRLDTTSLYLASEFSGTEYRVGQASVGSKTIRYRDSRAVAGVDFLIAEGLSLDIGAGYSAGRRFTFFDNERPDVVVKNTPFAKAALSYRW